MEELDNWLRALPGSPKTRTNFRANIGVLFSLARQRRIITENPIEFTAKPKLPDDPPAVFAVDQLRALLEAAQRVEPDVLPMLALGAFAGLRDAEIKRLDWAEVDRARKHIEITAVKAKSAKRRIVPIQANLAAWLRPYSEKMGRVVPDRYRGKIERLRKAAGLHAGQTMDCGIHSRLIGSPRFTTRLASRLNLDTPARRCCIRLIGK